MACGSTALHAQVQVTKLRGQARVELDHAQPVGGRVVEELHVEQAVREADGAQEALRHVQRTRLHFAARRLGCSQRMKACVPGYMMASTTPSACAWPSKTQPSRLNCGVWAGRGSSSIRRCAVPALGQAGLHHALEGLDQAADDPQLAAAEARVRLQFGRLLTARASTEKAAFTGLTKRR
jgi:hypothetical protein